MNALHKHGSQRKAAQAIGVSRSTFRRKVEQANEQGIKPRIRVKCVSEIRNRLKYNLRDRPLTGVFFTDAHNQPKLSRERFEWLGKFINDVEPDILVDGGDFDDFESLCAHVPNENYSGRFKPTFEDDLRASAEARQILDETIKVNVAKYVTLGNHEARLWDFEDRNPEMWGMMRHAYLEVLDKYNWNVTKYRDYLTLDDVDFTHIPMNGMSRPVGGKRVCVNVARDSVRDVAFGHVHSLNKHTEPKHGPQRSVTAFCGGCYMPEGYVADYAKGAQMHYWRGAHHFQIEDGKLHIVQSITIRDLQRAYDI